MAEQAPKTGTARRLWIMTDEDVAEIFDESRSANNQSNIRSDLSTIKLPTSEQLRAIRLSLGLSLAETASNVDVAESTLSQWEHGHTSPNVRKLRPLLDFYRERRDELEVRE